MAKIESTRPDLASMGRGGDTMLAHINPQEAQILKMMGGSGTTNPSTGLPEYKFSLKNFIRAAAVVVSIVYPPAAMVVGTYLGATGTAAAALGAATISAGVTLATGGTPEQALTNGAAAAIGAGVSSEVASGMAQSGYSSVASGATASASGSAAQTAAKGGDIEDIGRNAIAGAVGSGISSATGYDALGRGVGAGISSKGDPTSIAIGAAAGGYRDAGFGTSANIPGRQVASAADYTRDPGVVSDSPVSDIGVIDVAGQRDPANPQIYSDFGTVNPAANRPTDSKPSAQTKPTGRTASNTQLYSSILGAGFGTAPRGLNTGMGATTTTGLTSERGAGEIESEETGGKRKNVWNEESLRFKDALGL